MRRRAKLEPDKDFVFATDTETSYTDETRTARHVVLAGFARIDLGQKRVCAVKRYDNLTDYLDGLIVAKQKALSNVKRGRIVGFFHNLKYDASYLEDYLLTILKELQRIKGPRADSIHIKETYDQRMNVIYSLEFRWRGQTIELHDSMKIFPMALAKIGEFSATQKDVGDFDYQKIRQGKDDFTTKELNYFNDDIKIVAEIMLKHLRANDNVLKLTRPSYAFADLKKQVKRDDEKRTLPYYRTIFKPDFTESQYEWIRRAYYGGYTAVNQNPGFANTIFYYGMVLDCNSMYPSAMLEDYPDTSNIKTMTKSMFDNWDWYDDTKMCIVEVRLTKLSWIRDGKHVPAMAKSMSFRNNDDVKELADLDSGVMVTLTNLDFKRMLMNYDVSFDFLTGIYFPQTLKAPFKSFVLMHKREKERAVEIGDLFKKTNAKLTLNSCYGKFGQSPDFEDSKPILDTDGIVKHIAVDDGDEDRAAYNNIVIAAFVTAKARNNLFNVIQAILKNPDYDFIYCDTDSVHFVNHTGRTLNDLKEVGEDLGIETHPSKFGAWKLENDFAVAKFVRAKLYAELSTTNGWVIKGAGISPEGKDVIIKRIKQHGGDLIKDGRKHWQPQHIDKLAAGLSEFRIGMTVPSRRTRRIPGGIDIEDYQKTIRPKMTTAKI